MQRYTEAAADLSIISNRAHPDRAITITYTSTADLYKQIADERNRELCFENHRFFDIIRRKENLLRGGDCNSNVCGLTYPNNKFVLPIPTKEVEANKGMIQNPGFN
ncbi:SusD family protein [compost metagenome]